jgi:hypothetical protein
MRARSPRRAVPRALVVGLAIVSGLTTSAVPTAAVEGPFQMLGGPEDQLLPFVNGSYVIWTQSSVPAPNRFHAYGRIRGTTDVFRLNAEGTRGYTGGIDPDQDQAIYQQSRSGSSDLFLFNLETRRRRRLSDVVNSVRWERDPRISDRFILFARDTAAKTTVWLWERGTSTVEQLAGYDFTRFHVAPGAVGERYATWSVCGPLTCNAWIHDTELGTTKRIPAPDGRARYAPVVDEVEDRVYFVRSGQACGANVRIMRVPVGTLGAAPISVFAFPAGIDVGFTLSLARPPGQVDLWFSRFRCVPQQGDLFRLRDVGIA